MQSGTGEYMGLFNRLSAASMTPVSYPGAAPDSSDVHSLNVTSRSLVSEHSQVKFVTVHTSALLGASGFDDGGG